MCIVFTCGEHTFRKEVEGYESVVCRCHNCGNYSGHVIKSHPWFTFCFVPVIPLTFHGYEDVSCHICNFAQPLSNRPDVQAMKGGGRGGGGGEWGGPGGGIPLQQQGGPAQGWNNKPLPNQSPGPNAPMRYQ